LTLIEITGAAIPTTPPFGSLSRIAQVLVYKMFELSEKGTG